MRPKLLFLAACCAAAVLTFTQCAAPAERGRTYSLGERVQVGKLIYNIFDTQWLTQLGTGPTARVPKNRFFLIRLSVLNSGGEQVIVPTMNLIDERGQNHPEQNIGAEVPQWMGLIRHAAPAETLHGTVVFDVPPQHYRLRLMDEKEEQDALVDIPLSFESETPPTATQ